MAHKFFISLSENQRTYRLGQGMSPSKKAVLHQFCKKSPMFRGIFVRFEKFQEILILKSEMTNFSKATQILLYGLLIYLTEEKFV